MRLAPLALWLTLVAFGCNDCSARRSDEMLEGEIDHVLAQWPASVDAGVAEQQRLEGALAEALAFNTPASLTALLADPSASLETTSELEGEGLAHFTVESRERAARFVHEVSDRRGFVATFELLPDAGAKVSVGFVDPEAHKAEVYPAWAPQPADLWPCWGCGDRAERIIQKAALANELNAKLQRLRQLSRTQKRLKELSGYRPSPKALAAFDAVVAAKPADRTLIKLRTSSERLFLCRTGWTVEDCNQRLTGVATCTLNEPFANEQARPEALRSEERGEVCPLVVTP